MSLDQYRFTVFTATYNRVGTLHRVYDSLLKQTFKDFEWIIVDDGSTDKTRELVENWQQTASFPIRYFWQKNQHKKTAFNKGVIEAKGKLFLNADNDDEFASNTLETFYYHWKNIPENEREDFA